MARVRIAGDFHYLSVPPRSRKDDYIEACFRKFGKLLDGCDVLIIPGDFLEVPLIRKVHENLFVQFLQKYKNKKIYTIIGNHDLISMNVKSFIKTSLCSWHLSGIVNVIYKPIVIDNLTYRVPSVKYPLVPPKSESDNDVLLAHGFLDNELDKYNIIRSEDLIKENYKYVFLGHDHIYHPPYKLRNTIIYRPGSIMRVSVADWRNELHYYDIIDGKPPVHGTFEIEPAENVFHKEYVSSGKKEARKTKATLDELIDYFKATNKVHNKTAKSLNKFFTQFGVSNKIQDYLKEVYNRNNIKVG